MSDLEETAKGQKEQEEQDVLTDSVGETPSVASPAVSGLRARLRKFLNVMQHRSATTKTELTKDRTRPLALFIVGTVATALLLIAMFSTPARLTMQEMANRAAPNLGRPSPGNPSAPAQGSVTPLLNADVQSNDTNSDQLSSADIRGTSPRSSDPEEISGQMEPANANASSARLPRRTASSAGQVLSFPADDSDPLVTHRRNSTGAPTYSYGGPAASTVGSELPRTASYGDLGVASTDNRLSGPSPVRSSIVFVRIPDSVPRAAGTTVTSPSLILQTPLLPPGTRLVARLEAAVITAIKTPVVASIEYNYERNGTVLVPAGSKAIGDVQQASIEGDLSIRFHTLQMPNGREEKIDGAGVALDHKPLKGVVSGKNTGKKILSRTLSGVGTIAAYVVGAGGSGLSRTITGETLLRDRVAGNIAQIGEQELMNAAYSENISVTVPANTRFYVVLQKGAGSTTTSLPSRIVEPASPSAEIPTVQELRELMDLRREINRMYQESSKTQSPEQ